MKDLTIGKLAKEIGINIQTIRYYERIGLIKKPDTSESGYRLYSENAVDILRFIRHAKDIGFSLKQISELLLLDNNQDNTCMNIKKLAEIKVYEIDKRIGSLNLIRKELAKLISLCEQKKDNPRCPIIDTLKVKG